MYFRAAACTGALYHIDVYVVCGELPGLAAGVYQFGPHDGALHQLRAGDQRARLVEASGAEPAVAAAPAVLVCTSTFWRNAWKYQARTYRHCFWDTGTLLANLLAVAAADGVPARRRRLRRRHRERLLGLDTERGGARAGPDRPRRAPAPEGTAARAADVGDAAALEPRGRLPAHPRRARRVVIADPAAVRAWRPPRRAAERHAGAAGGPPGAAGVRAAGDTDRDGHQAARLGAPFAVTRSRSRLSRCCAPRRAACRSTAVATACASPKRT
jgi:SagB-type dehydrogenase family enzyme